MVDAEKRKTMKRDEIRFRRLADEEGYIWTRGLYVVGEITLALPSLREARGSIRPSKRATTYARAR